MGGGNTRPLPDRRNLEPPSEIALEEEKLLAYESNPTGR